MIMIQDIESALNGRLGKKDIDKVVEWTSHNPSNREKLLRLAFSDNVNVNSNALWCMTHLKKSNSQWLQSLQDFFIDSLLNEKVTSRKRMLLQLLRTLDYPAEDIRVDFLDFCMSKINSETEPYAIRCFSLYLAIKMCRHYPDLLSEFKERISLLNREPLSPGLRCAMRKVQKEIQLLSKHPHDKAFEQKW